VVFSFGGADARAFASQGQQRSLALAWKIAELRALQELTGRRPVLLLDDVMSELDSSRRSALAALVEEASQTLITTTNLGYFAKETLEMAYVVELP
jgi:DNA replication and repair protein RecF